MAKKFCVIGVWLTLQAVACSSDFVTCFSRAHQDYRDAQRRWHRAIHQAVVSRDPGLEPLSKLNLELQLAMVAQAEKRLQVVAERTPPKIQTDKGLSGLLNPPGWTATDEADLVERDPECSRLTKREATLRSQSDGHADWPALQLFRSEVMASPSVKSAQQALQAAGEEFLSEARSCIQQQ